MANYQLSKTGAEIDAALSMAVAHETSKADIDGSYDGLTAGKALIAEQIESSVYVEDKVPYNFRPAGGSADIGNRLNDKIVGGSVVWNQLAKYPSSSNWSTTQATFADGVGTLTATARYGATYSNIGSDFVDGHKYLLSIKIKTGVAISGNTVRFAGGNAGYSQGVVRYLNTETLDSWVTFTGVYNFVKNDSATSNYYIYLQDNRTNENLSPIMFKEPQVFDLTAMFGATIADYVYGLETATTGAGVAWFKKLFPKAYYAYNAGAIMSVNVSAHNTIGFNAFNPTTGTAKLVGGMQYQLTGTYTSFSYADISGNAETITLDANGKFTPTNNGILTIVGGNDSDTCVHLVWDGERDGEYEAYVKYEYPLDESLTLRGIPKLNANNELYYDGDTYESGGTVKRNYEYRAYASGDESLANAITDGTHTVVKLATPTTESADPFTNPQIVDDFGTEEYIDYAESQGTRDVAIPVGHETQYQNNLRAKLEMSPNSPDGNGDYIVRQTNGINEYVPLVIPEELPDAPTTDGTYRLTVTVADGTPTLSWVAVT